MIWSRFPVLWSLLLVSCLVVLLTCTGCPDESEADDDISAQSDDDDATGDDDDTTPEPEELFRGLWASMEISSSGETVVAYYDYLEGGLAVARGTGGSFTHEQVDGYTYETEGGLPVNPGDRGRYLDMVLDSSDTPHIAYHDLDETSLMYATFDGEAWTSETVDGTSGSASVGTFNSIALDDSGNPAIAYYDEGEKTLKLAHFSGGWVDEIVDEGELLADGTAAELDEPDVGKYTHLVIDGSTYWIAYYDVANGNLKLAHGTPGAWTIETLAGDSDGDKGAWPFLYVESGTVMRIAFQDVGEQDLLVGRYEAGALSWSAVDTRDFVGADSVIANVGSGLRVHYFDGQDNDVKQAVDMGDGTWDITTIISDGAVGFSNNLVFHDSKMKTCSFNYTTGDFHYEEINP